MFVLTALCVQTIDLQPGHYAVKMLGARGEGYTDFGGGLPAYFNAKLEIEGHRRATYHAGKSNEGGYGAQNLGLNGGGYSALYIDDDLYVMVGGGGGALPTKDGIPAGGIGYVYDYDIHSEMYVKVQKSGNSIKHQGGESDNGSGGGNGYFGGEGGKPPHHLGQGGSSYVRPDSFNGPQPYLYDGIEVKSLYLSNYESYVSIEAIRYCSENCTKCKVDVNVCEKCDNGKLLYFKNFKNKYCVNSCDQTDEPTYQSNQDGACYKCFRNCTKCTDYTHCSQCQPGYHLTKLRDSIICTNDPDAPIYVPPESTTATESTTTTTEETSTESTTTTEGSTESTTTTEGSTESTTTTEETSTESTTTTEGSTESTTTTTTTTEETSTESTTTTEGSTESTTTTEGSTESTTTTEGSTESTTTTEGSTESTTTLINDSTTTNSVNEIIGGNKQFTGGEGDTDKEPGFPWWIIVAVVGGVVLIVIIMVIIIRKKADDEESIEMAEENVTDAKVQATTTVTVENPIYFDSIEIDEDPFKNDFDEGNEPSEVFHPHVPEDGNSAENKIE